jgi:DNA-binding SARP family transcriptional activator
MMRLEIRLLGFPSVHLDGRAVDLPLRKALALLAHVADTRAPVGRDQMASLLWPEADTGAARARLRRTLHKLGLAAGAELIEADRTSLSLATGLDVRVDTHAFEAACGARALDKGALDKGALDEAVALYGGDFLDGLSIDGSGAFEEWAFFRREALRSRLVQALERLIEASISGGEPGSAVAYATRLVGLDPLSERAHRHLISAHLAGGDRTAARRQLTLCAQMLEAELGVAPDPATAALLDEAHASVPATPSAASEAPRTRYAELEGLHLAYQITGGGPVDIVLVPGFVSHVERVWEEPRLRAWLAAASRIGRVILFDRRGVGLSDRIGATPTVEATAQDILAVLDAAGSRRAVLIGASEGAPGCIRFAADHPGRLAGMVLWGALAKGSHAPDYPFALTAEQFDTWKRRLIAQWGGPAELEVFAPSLAGDRRVAAWWAGLLRAASSPGAVRGVLDALRDADVRHLLARISVPTRVLHRAGDRAVRVEAGRHLAQHIPAARLVELPGEDHWFWAGDWEPLIRHTAALVATCR